MRSDFYESSICLREAASLLGGLTSLHVCIRRRWHRGGGLVHRRLRTELAWSGDCNMNGSYGELTSMVPVGCRVGVALISYRDPFSGCGSYLAPAGTSQRYSLGWSRRPSPVRCRFRRTGCNCCVERHLAVHIAYFTRGK